LGPIPNPQSPIPIAQIAPSVEFIIYFSYKKQFVIFKYIYNYLNKKVL
jgi:hypothetical protein